MITVVIPTIGRPGLDTVLAALDPALEVIVVDDRPGRGGARAASGARVARALGGEGPAGGRIRVLRTGGRGPAAARNAGWRAARTPWIAFLDDDVVPQPGWAEALRADLAGLPEEVAGSQGRIEVPLPAGRRLTDAERNTSGLAEARWITADMAYRRTALERTGGFDERFPRAYREDADLALRMFAAGYRLVRGGRVTRHPFRDDGPWASVRLQRGNADDALMRRVHGPGWRAAIGGAPGRLRRHALVTGLGALAAVLWAVRPGRAAAAAGAAWALLTAEFAWARIAPGPRTREEIRRMMVTSVVIPPVACARRLAGEVRVRR
ncbi:MULTISPECIES: glycosyltransferase family 2 protein [Streptosporangium]|uniref:Glycosyltransferase involved in cell wall biosynthesis n=1 Tax=Streptosporangium brasiliense TaxID=47480 RepID=A0ABT9QX20_9ACTN|nr:glycosyltransferase [Streptosporangium brasiliense]MDP9861511.1 glycosyltransferase involved in cell wall biosynthesis [Streptosporangium brasiliense]